MTDLPGMALRVLYLAAGHTQVAQGGVSAPEPEQLARSVAAIQETIDFLHTHAGLSAGQPVDGHTAYQLGSLVLVVVDAGLDLRDTIAAINRHYAAFCQENGLGGRTPWRWGACIEINANVPRAPLTGPVVIHARKRPYPLAQASYALGVMAAAEVGAATGIVARHYYNHLQSWVGGGRGYYFINRTEPLALMIAGQELAGDGRAVGRLLMRLAGGRAFAQTAVRAMHLGDAGILEREKEVEGKVVMEKEEVRVDWPQLTAIGPRAIVTCHAWQLHAPGSPPGVYWLWRPWFDPGWLRNLTPAAAVERIVALWEKEDRPDFDGLQIGNEPNLGTEHGWGSEAQQEAGNEIALERFLAWWPEVAGRVRELFPGKDIHTAPLTTHGLCRDIYWWERLAPLVRTCDYLNVHCYWANEEELRGSKREDAAFRYRQVHKLYPAMPIFISEFGCPGGGSRAYGEEIAWYWAHLDDYVHYAAPFIWNSFKGFWDGWLLQDTAAAQVLASNAGFVGGAREPS